MTKRLLRLLRIAPLALLFAGIASAQTTGTIIGVVTDASTGKPVAGAVVIATSPSLQGEQTAITDGNGNYRFVLLPPGEYKLGVQLEGFKPFERSDIVVRLDKTIRAPLSVVPEAVQMEEQVVRTGAAPVVNIGSAESGSVVSSEFMASIPVGRSFDAIAVVAPTAQSDTYGVGFAGAQSPENTYILDGMNVADPVYGSLSTNILSNFVEEIDVKTGNFSAEYGRATGGVVNVVAKSGSNEFHGSVFSNFTPSFLVSPDGEVVGLNGQAVASRTVASEGSYDLDFGAEVGGPIMKDKLWFYAGFAPVITERYTERFLRANVLAPDGPDADTAGDLQQDANGFFINRKLDGTSKTYNTGSTAYQFAGKLTYLLDENHQVSASTYLVPGNRTGIFAGMNGPASRHTFEVDEGSYNVLGRYGGKFLDKKLIVELQGGWHRTKYTDQPTDFQRNTPAMQWVSGTNVSGFGGAGRPALGWQFRDFNAFEPLSGAAAAACADDNACLVQSYTTGGYGFGEDYNADRLAARLSASYLLEAFGSHNWKAGVDLERNTYDIGKFYSGGQFYRADARFGEIYNIRGFGRVLDASGEAISASDIVEWIDVERSESVTNSFAYYLQDSWLIPNTNVTLNAGIRLETQTMEGTSAGGIKGIDINNMWAPRLQAIWDFTGTGRGKVGASWGRFYYAIPLDMGDRAFGNEEQAETGWDCGFAATTDVNPTNAAIPVDPESSGGCGIIDGWWDGTNSVGNIGGITPVQPDLKGIYVDQWGAQFEYELLSDLSIGFDYQGRRQGSTIEDMSDNDGNTYFIGNPGEGSAFEAVYLPDSGNRFSETKNPKQVESTDPFTRRAVTVNFPKPTRDYDGFTFKVTKNFSQKWLAAASYTYSALRGNYAGVFRPEDGQLDPGITSEYDLASLMANRKGFLPGDVPHTVKLFGAYTYNFGRKLSVTGSGAFNGLSGTPVNALGAHNLYGAGQAFIIQRGGAGRTPFRTTFDLGGRLEYTIRAPYAVRFSVDVFNLFNSQKAVNYDQNYTNDQVLPIAGIDCESDAAGSSNPIAKLQADCPDLAYLKTVDGRPVSVNPNFGRPAATTTAFQNPLSLRIGLALTF